MSLAWPMRLIASALVCCTCHKRGMTLRIECSKNKNITAAAAASKTTTATTMTDLNVDCGSTANQFKFDCDEEKRQAAAQRKGPAIAKKPVCVTFFFVAKQ